MKYLQPVLAAAALCALTVTPVHAGNVGATTGVTSSVSGTTSSSGNASATVVATSIGVASSWAATSPLGQAAAANTADTNHVQANARTGLLGGAAGAHGTANGFAFAAAWATP